MPAKRFAFGAARSVEVSEKDKIIGLLGEAGVTVNGREPWDIQIHDERTWTRVFAQGSLGLGEAYMDGWWDAADLAEFFNRVLRARIADKLRVTPNLVWQSCRRSSSTCRPSPAAAASPSSI